MRKSLGRSFMFSSMVVVVVACGTADVGEPPNEEVTHVRARLSDLERVIGFERVSATPANSDWTTTNGVLSSSSQHSEGGASLGVADVGYTQLTSVSVSGLTQVGQSGSIDVLVPGTGSIPWGTAQVFFDAPEQNVWNAPLPHVALQDLARGEFHRLTFPIDSTLRSQLTSATTLVFRIAVNVPTTSQPVLIDRLSFGEGSGGGGAGGIGGTGASSGTGANGGAGGGGAGGSGGSAGTAGSSGTDAGAGSSGTAGSGGVPAGPVVSFFVRLPDGVGRHEVALAAGGENLMINDRARLMRAADPAAFASASSVGATAMSRLGVEAHLQDLWAHSVPNVSSAVELANRAHAHGAVRSSGVVARAPDSVVDGTLEPSTNLEPIQTVSWEVAFPPGAPVSVEPNQTIPLAPGAYGSLTVKAGAHLRLTDGRYTFDGAIGVESNAFVDIDNSAGAVHVYGRGLTFRGEVTKSATTANVVFGVAGPDAVAIENMFDGLLVAPYATVSFATSTRGYRGSTFAKGIVLHQNTTYQHVPWNPQDFCAGKQCGDDSSDGFDGACSGLCGNGQSGCISDAECGPGSVCAYGMGPRFNFPEGTNVCWPIECTRQDPSQPHCGVNPAQCGTCPACVPQCVSGSTGPDGCGGFCAPCPAGESRMPNGDCGAFQIRSESVETFPIPLTALPTDEAGAIPGSFQVTDRGTAAYTIDIRVPPGRMGMQPALSLNYTSTKNNGPLGMGWSLGGLSSITRCQSIVGREGVTRSVSFTNADRFCLDGQALVQVPSSIPYGGHDAEYRTEVDTFVKVISHHPLGSDGSLGPSHFTVFTKDGRVMSYGTASPNDDSSVFVGRARRIWGLKSVQDRSGNRLRVDYKVHRAVGRAQSPLPADVDTGELVPEVISYGAESIAHGYTRFVRFVYDERPDPRWHYVGGVAAFATARLRSVETYVGPELATRYKLDYEQHADNETRLQRVWECAEQSGAEKCLEPTTFEYRGWQKASIATDGGNDGTLVMDADGDGRQDLLTFASHTGPTWRLVSPARQTATLVAGPARFCADANAVMDVNRDGRDDVIDVCQPAPTSVAGPARAYVSNGVAFFEQPLGFSFKGTLKVIDLDGDGLRDIIACAPKVLGRHVITGIWQNHGTTFGTPVGAGRTPFDFIELEGPGKCEDLTVLDVDGDGQEELVVPNDGQGRIQVFDPETVLEPNEAPWVDWGTSLVEPDGKHWLVDGNGDGLKDIVTLIASRAPDGTAATTVRIQFNTGRSFNAAAIEPYVIGRRLDVLLGVRAEVRAGALDYDGDGREDLVTEWGVVRFVQTGARTATFESFPAWTPVFAIADVNGDGSGDIVGSGATLTNQGRAGLLSRVVDGNGKQIEVHYQAGQELADLGEPPLTQRTYGQGVCGNSGSSCLRLVAPLVSAHEESQVNFVEQDVSGALTKIVSPGPAYTYQYFGAQAGLGGRGWYGFASRIVRLEPLWVTVNSYHNEDFLFAGRLERSLKRFLTPVPANRATSAVATRIEETSFHWAAFAGDFATFPFVTEQTSEVREGSDESVLTKIEVQRTPNAYGTVRAETARTWTGEQLISTLLTGREIDDDPEHWLLGRVTDVVTQSARGTPAFVTRRQHFEYVPGTQLLSSIEREPDPNTPGQANPARPTQYLRTTLERTTNGNVRKACSTDVQGVSARRCSEVIEFDADQVFPRRVRDAEQFETEVRYSARNGALLWMRDPNGLLSQFAQDAFGRPQQVRTPASEGTIKYFHTTMAFAPSGPPITTRAAFGVTEDFRGAAPSTRIFDAFGRVVQERAPAFQGGTTPVRTEFEYDALGRLVLASLPHLGADTSQGVIEYTYDGFGRKSSEVYPGNAAVKFYYPSRNNVDGAFAYLFDAIDMPSAADDVPATALVVEKPRQNLDITVSDSHGNPVRTVQAGQDGTQRALTEYTYTAYDILTRVDSEGGSTHVTSDSLGRPTLVDDPALGVQRYTYNGFDEVATHVDGNLVHTEFSYDSKGRPTQIRDVTRSEIVAKWVYGQLDSAADPNERGRLIGAYRQAKPGAGTGNWMRYRYQSNGGVNRGLPHSIEYALGGTPDALGSGGERFLVGFEYQPESGPAGTTVPWRLDVVQYPTQGGSFAVRYGYDPGTGAVDSVASTADLGNPYWRLLDTDQGFRPKQESFGNDLITHREYYAIPSAISDCQPGSDTACIPGSLRSIVTHQSSNPAERLQNVAYRYNRNGDLRLATHADAPAQSRQYRYDGLDRLVYDRHPDSPIQLPNYFYDLAGNFTFKDGAGTYTYDIPGKPFQVRTAGGATAIEYQYDDGGNVTRRAGTPVAGGVQALAYNQFNLPYKVTSGELTAAAATELEYDGSGARVIKRRRAGPADDSPLAEVTTTIGELYEQVTQYAGGSPTSTTHHYRIYAGGRQIAQVQRTAGTPEQIRYIHDDQLGSTSVLSDIAGNALETRQFTSFGEPLGVDFTQTGVTSGFTAHQHDADLGLVNMRGRIYDPKIGRFLQADPFINGIDAAGLNRYSYVRNNPINFVDPSGFQSGPVVDRPFGGDTVLGQPGATQYEGPPPEGAGPGSYQPIGTAGELGMYGGDLADLVVFQWMPDVSGRQHADAKQQGATAQIEMTTRGGGGGPPSGGSGGSQEGAPSTTQQPTSAPQGPDTGSWQSGNDGGTTSYTPLSSVSGSGSSFGHWLTHANYWGSSIVQSPHTDKVLAWMQYGASSIAVAAATIAVSEFILAAAAVRIATGTSTVTGAVAVERAIVPYFPPNNGFLGATSQRVLQVGETIDRIGGSAASRFFSPTGTPLAARALPPGTTGPLRMFEVLKPFSVESGTVAPAFGKLGFGTQFRSSMTLGELIEQGFLREVL